MGFYRRRPGPSAAAAAMVAAILLAGGGGRVWAADEALPPCATQGGTWSGGQIGVRAATLDRELREEARRARQWRWAWTGINAGLAVLSFASLPYATAEQRPALIVGGIGSTISTALTVAWPLDVERAEPVHGNPGCEELRAAEARAAAFGRDERDRTRWPWHLLNAGVGLAYFGILGLGWDQWEGGAWAGLTAFAIGEIQTLTQPTRGASRWSPTGSDQMRGLSFAFRW